MYNPHLTLAQTPGTLELCNNWVRVVILAFSALVITNNNGVRDLEPLTPKKYNLKLLQKRKTSNELKTTKSNIVLS
jgi:hypothetical protein